MTWTQGIEHTAGRECTHLEGKTHNWKKEHAAGRVAFDLEVLNLCISLIVSCLRVDVL